MYRNDKHNINITKEFYEYLVKGHKYSNGKITLTYEDFERVKK
jgi:hypothetical protein